MANYDDALKVMDAVAKYREDESLPDDPHEIDRLCERLFSDDGFDEVAIEWKRISNYEREVHGGGIHPVKAAPVSVSGHWV